MCVSFLFLAVTGGRNGYGAKLANIFSTEFTVETLGYNSDEKRYYRYKQTFRDNMTKKGEPTVTPTTNSSQFTRITFSPDLARCVVLPSFPSVSLSVYGVRVRVCDCVCFFGFCPALRFICMCVCVPSFNMAALDEDTVALLMKRVYDIAGVTEKSLKVVLNGEQLAVHSFKDYVGLYVVRVPHCPCSFSLLCFPSVPFLFPSILACAVASLFVLSVMSLP